MIKSTSVYIDPEADSGSQGVRRRNAPATRQAILEAALQAFCEHGYDGCGLREIASAAGVTAVLINRYFGTKEALFAAAVDAAFEADSPFAGDLASLAPAFAKVLVAKTRAKQERADGFLLLLRSAANPRAAEILRNKIEQKFAEPLGSALRGRGADVRAALFLAQVAGFQLMSQVIGLGALKKSDARAMTASLAGMFEQTLLTDD